MFGLQRNDRWVTTMADGRALITTIFMKGQALIKSSSAMVRSLLRIFFFV